MSITRVVGYSSHTLAARLLPLSEELSVSFLEEKRNTRGIRVTEKVVVDGLGKVMITGAKSGLGTYSPV